MNSVPMENVFGPAVFHPGHDAEHVLQTERDTGPVVGLDFRHGHNKIRPENSLRQPKTTETAVFGFRPSPDQLVTIQIYEWDRPMFKFVFEASFADNHFSVTLMARAISDDNPAGA